MQTLARGRSKDEFLEAGDGCVGGRSSSPKIVVVIVLIATSDVSSIEYRALIPASTLIFAWMASVTASG